MEIKKHKQNTVIQLSQMNREIESTDRLSNPSMHFPTRRDIFGGKRISSVRLCYYFTQARIITPEILWSCKLASRQSHLYAFPKE